MIIVIIIIIVTFALNGSKSYKANFEALESTVLCP